MSPGADTTDEGPGSADDTDRGSDAESGPGRGAIEADRGEIEAPNGGTDTPSGDSSPTQSPSAAEPTSAGRAPLPGARDLPTVDELAPSPTQPAEVSEVVDAVAVDSLDSDAGAVEGSEEHTSELPSLMRISYAVFCLYNTNKR